MTGPGGYDGPAAPLPAAGPHRPPLVLPRPGVIADRIGHAPIALFVVVALAYAAGAEAAWRWFGAEVGLGFYPPAGGHSLAAATAMGQLRSAGRALAPIASDPADLIERIERFAVSVNEARYTTLAVVFVDVDRGVLRYACAGHLPPLLVHADGAAEYLMDARGMPLAGATGVVRRWAEAPLRTGDLLVLYTDGLVERRSETIDDGLDRLLTVVTGVRHLDPDALCEAVVDAMLEGRAQRDDVAMLVARPVPTRFEHEMPAASTELAPLRRALSRWLARVGIGPDDIADILIAVGEGTANAVEHAYCDGSAGTVHVVVELDGDDLRATIRDDGSWRAVPAPGNRGRGTAIMRAVATRVDVGCEPDGTTVVIEHRLSRADRTVPPRTVSR